MKSQYSMRSALAESSKVQIRMEKISVLHKTSFKYFICLNTRNIEVVSLLIPLKILGLKEEIGVARWLSSKLQSSALLQQLPGDPLCSRMPRPSCQSVG
jgi:hypothetical protein